MLKKTAKNIHELRIVFLLGFSVFFLAYLGLNPVDLSRYYGAKFSDAVGMNVGVKENPYNKLAADLKAKEASLIEREAKLNELENRLANNPNNERLTTWLLGGGIIVLFVLILINFVLDRRYRRKNINTD